MPKFKVFVVEAVEKRVDLEAEDAEQAESIVRDCMANDGEFYRVKDGSWRFTDGDTIEVDVWEHGE